MTEFIYNLSQVLTSERMKNFRKKFILALSFFFTLILFLGVYNVYAIVDGQEYDGYLDPADMNKDAAKMAVYQQFKDPDKAYSTIYNLEVNAKNAKTQALLCQTLAPYMCTGYAQILEDDSISTGAKLGVSGYATLMQVTALNSQPEYDVGKHLAESWVPGYQRSQSVYAQSGYNYLMNVGIVDYWRVGLGFSYVVFILALIFAGFMIMFRNKIGGQTLVTVYNTIPNVMLNLALATFSFAIVGAILTLSAFLTRLIKSIIGPAVFIHNTPFDIAGRSFLSNVINVVPIVGPLISATWSAITKGSNFWYALGQNNWFVSIAVIIASIGASFGLFFVLVKAVFSILVDTVLGPVNMAIATIPGMNEMRTNWFKRLAINSLTFPLVLILINIPLLIELNNIDIHLMPLAGGELALTGIPDYYILGIIHSVVGLYCYFLAIQSPKFLKSLFPIEENKGLKEATEGATASLQKVPFLKHFGNSK